MKSILRTLGRLNTKALASIILAILLSGSVLLYAKAEGVSGYNGQKIYNDSLVPYSYVYNNIEKIYGTDAKNAYINGVITGDYTQFRTAIGDWRPTNQLAGVNVKPDGSDYTNNPVGIAQAYEATAYRLFGKYGTVADLFAYAAQYGYDLNDTSKYNEFTLNVTLWKTIPMPAKKTAPVSQPATKTASAASNSKVEALKSYKGNTAEFNAYYYYMNYPDLQTAIGADGKALLKHYNEFGKAEGRVASKSIK
ncbi:MAG: hypothetical protein E7308_07640 [Butyrivibrio sp.]|nr:hypothetical protein [Butyrivibrio sp.]